MDDGTKQLLTEINYGCKMAVKNMDRILVYVEDDGLKELIKHYKYIHEGLEEKSGTLLEKNGEGEKEPGAMVSVFSWMTTEIKMMMRDDRTEVAKLMMNGCNMGIQSIAELNNKYENADSNAKKIAEELLYAEEKFMKALKDYL